MQIKSDELLWTEKYRPRKIEDCILPSHLKATFQKFVDDKKVPTLLLSGKAGMGKTTVAMAMLEELEADYIKINASKDGNIDTLRNDIQQFASTTSLIGGRKYVILDEADHLTQFFQPALRSFMEDFSRNCGFILTCNYRNRIIPAIQSRCSVVEFKISKEDKKDILIGYAKRLMAILDAEEVVYKKDVVGPFLLKYFPDMRRTINEAQFYTAASGQLDEGVLAVSSTGNVGTLLEAVKNKDFAAARKWFGENHDLDSSTFYTQVYEQALPLLVPASVPEFIMVLGKYQYQAAFVASQEINNVAFVVEVMASCKFK